jgi:two-component system OmpR family sensor kinase
VGRLPGQPERPPLPSSGRARSPYYYDRDGRQIGTVTSGEPASFGSFSTLRDHADQGRSRSTRGGSWRIEVVSMIEGGYGVAGVSLAEVDQTQNRLLMINGVVTLLVLVGIGGAAATVARLGLRPLHRMEAAAAEIAGGDLTRRVEDADPHTELGRLGWPSTACWCRSRPRWPSGPRPNSGCAVPGRRRARAAHPAHLDPGLRRALPARGRPAGPELDEAMGAIGSEVGRMRLLVNDLLLLARLDEERPLERRPVDLLEVAADTVRDAHVRVPARFVMLDTLHNGHETLIR